ncbi:hypothetical protein NPIL_217511 [Nephila pilipes]|uniref:Uncharacterized protein n=1 Tax=Nephila pilipes TaxID=299642 RepID=A0A8X6USP3_NEPPI|nr:hypothetical protein NPIL_217511 [Nephila pilipes]
MARSFRFNFPVLIIFKIMADKNKIFIMKDSNDLETKGNMVLCNSDDVEDIVLGKSDTDEEEHISERDDLESE